MVDRIYLELVIYKSYDHGRGIMHMCSARQNIYVLRNHLSNFDNCCDYLIDASLSMPVTRLFPDISTQIESALCVAGV